MLKCVFVYCLCQTCYVIKLFMLINNYSLLCYYSELKVQMTIPNTIILFLNSEIIIHTKSGGAHTGRT